MSQATARVGRKFGACLAEYLSLLHAKAEGRSEAEMAREICRIDPSIEAEHAVRIVKSRLKQAQSLADNPQRLLAETRPSSRHRPHRSKVR